MIKIKNLHIQYQGPAGGEIIPVLDGLDLTIAAGEAVALMGPNGSGKTTLARCLNGLVLPAQGEVLVDGMSTKDAQHLREIRKRVGLVFQNPENQIVSATVEREVAFGLENLGVPHADMHAIVDEMLELFGLQEYRSHPPHLLSGGEMQRLALAAVMAMRPAVLVFDEPTSLLDPAGRNLVLELIRKLRRQSNQSGHVTTLFVTQLPEETLGFERLLILDKGRLIFDDAPHRVFENVAALQEIGVPVPIEYEVWQRLRDKSGKRDVAFNPSDFEG